MLKRQTDTTKLFLIDDLNPEDVAMLQALYSRSGESVEKHLERVKEVGAGKFMASYYVGYGHKSIADCGSTTLFAEGVSMLAAKAVQDWPLYSGQESSTRYLDMASRPVVDPFVTERSGAILRRWLNFYVEAQEPTAAEVRRRYPRREGEPTEVYDKAVKARVFDVLRAFLPAGTTTQLSWHTNLRQAGDHLSRMRFHPLKEIRNLAEGWSGLLGEAYPSSGAAVGLAGVSGVGVVQESLSMRDARGEWEKLVAQACNYPSFGGLTPFLDTTIPEIEILKWCDIIKTRPRGCVLPHFMSDFGRLKFRFELDFGSFRDLQRHRNGVCRMPLLTMKCGFESWYIDQLDSATRALAASLIRRQEEEIGQFDTSPTDMQYLIPMGYLVPCSVTWGLPAALYVMELRSGPMVHPTLRRVVLEMVKQFRDVYPNVPVHACEDPDPWDVRRGQQDITRRPAS